MRKTSSYNGEINNRKIIIYGAGRYGELAYWGLKNIGITPIYFADKSAAGQRYFGVEVIPPENIADYPDAAVLIASLSYFYEMLAYVQQLGHEHVYDILDLIRLDYDESVLTKYARYEKHNYVRYQSVVDNKNYSEIRKNYRYYKYIRSLLSIMSVGAHSILDVGSRGVDNISFLPIERKVSIDLEIPLEAPGVESIKGDFLQYEFDSKFDIVCCFQVLEHIEDACIGEFARRLLEIGGVIIVSVPYMWEKGKCKWHCQDPVNEEKLTSWFGRHPVFLYNVYDGVGRMIAIFVNEQLTNRLSDINEGNACEFMAYDIEKNIFI